ncbi:hypothetical protein [Merismopedia glauca]|uniref:Uncharacterized protein n=1 Tax=Merismopedia glauca CCAP 1448/3 TaxID=1296344 RepID=A0A2T1C0Y9_9CYAN|nr:hypothetical protein [Merismopedia glauca]PSB01931.1 hypothetical protein C7B64_15845 [Merismopedia glauca CCAP 1448/3]
MNHKLILLSLLTGTILTGGLIVNAHDNSFQAPSQTVNEKPLATPVKNSEFAFQGVVSKVEYRSSDNAHPVPHTFVTFKVEKLLKGASKPEFVTLRFVGGTDGKGNFLSVSGVPLFDVGDRDILFAKGNGQFACPLVNCGSGRLRVINNQVFTDDGRPLLINSKGLLGEGKPVALNEVLTNKIGDVTIKDVFGTETGNPRSLDGSPSAVKPTQLPTNLVGAQPLQPLQVESLVKSQILELSRTQQLVTPRNVVLNADSKTRFILPEVKSVTPLQIVPPTVNQSLTTPKNETETRELELLRKNGGNPVFTNSKPR